MFLENCVRRLKSAIPSFRNEPSALPQVTESLDAGVKADFETLRTLYLPTLSEVQQAQLFNLLGLLRQRGWVSQADSLARIYGFDRLTNLPEPSLYGAVSSSGEKLLGVFGDSVLSTLHFKPLSDPERQRIAFGHGVRIIDVEIFSQCNRRCHYCSNSVMDRRTWNKFMDPEVYRRLLHDLKEIDWDGNFRIIGLNEPLIHREFLLERLTEAHATLPKALITVFTNGDYLTPDYLDALYVAGVRALYLSIHLSPGAPFEDEKIFQRIREFEKRLNVTTDLETYIPGRSIITKVLYKDMLATMFQNDYEAIGHDRGGLLEGIGPQDISRTAACTTPAQMMVISYNGNVLPCCHFVGDADQHKGLIVGTMTPETSIFDIYGGEAYTRWRREMFTLKAKRRECKNCVDYVDSPMHNDAALVSAEKRLAEDRDVHICYQGVPISEGLDGIKAVTTD